MVRFDRAAPGEGMMIYSRLENGKAYLEFQFFLKTREMQAEASPYNELDVMCVQQGAVGYVRLADYMAHIQVYDQCHSVVLDVLYPLQEDELAKGMLLYPHLWKGSIDPYIYLVKVHLLDKKKRDAEKMDAVIDTLEKQLPLRTLQLIPRKGWFLNGEGYILHPVVYELPVQIRGDIPQAEQIRRDLQLMREMGANTICLLQPEFNDEFTKLCEERGFLIWYLTGTGQLADINALLSSERDTPMDLYYYYKARWSRIPFVYPVRNSLTQQKNGNYSLMVYSNQKKVALYVEGVLFEFQTGEVEFLFEEIPTGKYPLQITVEAGECRVGMTVY